MKRIIKDYFTFSKKERNAVIVLTVLIAVLIMLPYYFKSTKTASASKPVAWQPPAKSTQEAVTADEQVQPYQNQAYTKQPRVLFEFDPNTIDEAGWIKLGVREKTAKTIIKYCSKGGKFRTPEDIRKIWSLSKEDADVLIPYVRISEPYTAKNSFNNFNNKTTELKPPSVIDINTATIEDWKRLPGLDPGMPYRIFKFKEKLGGFLSVEQVKETYGITDSSYTAILPYLRYGSTTIKKININTADEATLDAHPYISKTIAKLIVIYRNEQGTYKSLDDLKKIKLIKEDVLKKILPYLTVE